MQAMTGASPFSSRRFRFRTYVQHEAVLFDDEAMLGGDRVLQLFDLFAEEFDDLAGVESNHVIVVRTAVQFEDGVDTFEIVALDKASGLEIRRHPVDRCQSDDLIEVDPKTVAENGSTSWWGE